MEEPMFTVHLRGKDFADITARLEELTGGAVAFTTGEITPGRRCDVLVAGRVSREELRLCTGLRTIVIPYAGVPRETIEALEDYPHVSLHNIHHNAASASEMAVSLMLAAVKRIVPAHEAMRKGDWTPRYNPEGLLIEGSRVLILGMGAIGTRIAAVCRAMGAEVSGICRNPRPGCFAVSELHGLLPKTDILVISVPLTAETEGMIGGEELGLLPEKAVLVNISRGPVVEEESLYLALKEERLGAAAIDVWYRYPASAKERTATPPSAFPFHELPNVVMSPHRGGGLGLSGVEARRIEELARLLNSLRNGDTGVSRVYPSRGY